MQSASPPPFFIMANILILTPQLPYPAHQGTSLRNFHIIRGLAETHDVTLLSFLEPNQTADVEKIRPLHTLCTNIHTIPVPQRSTAKRLMQLAVTRRPDMAHRLFSRAFNAKLRQLLQETAFDIVQIEGIELARTIEEIRVVGPLSKILFDDHNAETELQRRNFLTDLRVPKRWPAAVYSWFQVRRLRRFERWACEVADAVTAVSDTDRRHLQTLLGDKASNTNKITVIPNSIDVRQYQALSTDPISFDLLFSGKMDYRPNVDAVLWFAEEVWPRILQKRPSTTWAIVGQKPHARLAPLNQLPGVTITGWVDSVLPYLHGAKIPIMPFRIGSGTRLKIVESMAVGKAIVSTSVGAEGFGVQHERDLLLADSANGFATAVLRLLENPTERARFGQSAQQFAKNYDWRQVIPIFTEIYRNL
ncbi:MAG: glycosyltransferase [Chloroflexi bacterium]|nr:glycosyltransferase [Chloroflexota bacterium]